LALMSTYADDTGIEGGTTTTTTTTTSYTIDGSALGPRLDGFGAISGGGSLA
jgi:hypothetical protein